MFFGRWGLECSLIDGSLKCSLIDEVLECSLMDVVIGMFFDGCGHWSVL